MPERATQRARSRADSRPTGPTSHPGAASRRSVETETVKHCPLCDSTRHRPWARCRDRLHQIVDQEFIYSRCRACGLVFLSVRPTETAAAELYPDQYASYLPQNRASQPARSTRAATSSPVPRVLRKVARRGAKLVESAFPDRLPTELERVYTPPSGHAALVDFGCGRPEFLDQARDRGWYTTMGVDMTPSVLERIEAAGHVAHATADFPEAVADGSIAVIRLNHVLEHLYDPATVLRTTRRKLVPGGVAHVAVPNGRSLSATLFRSYWYNADPRHVVQYAPQHVRSLADRAGFSDVRIVHEVITRDIARSWGYLLEDRGRLDHVGVAALGDDPRLSRLLRYPAWVSAAAGRGDRFHAFLRA